MKTIIAASFAAMKFFIRRTRKTGNVDRYRGWLDNCTSASMTRARAAASLRTR